jgi:hypothetical protein
VQTFLPYADFTASNEVLDNRRLGKQRVETYQILRALTFPRYAWKNHPAVRMWRGFIPALVAYGLASCDAWVSRGFPDRVRDSLLTFTGGQPPELASLRRTGQLPPWFGCGLLHESHQSALLRKNPEHYRPYFPDVPDDLPYLWPSSAFPYWPLRRPGNGSLTPEAAFSQLGYETPRPGQAEAIAAVAAGRDVVLAMPKGGGATATGLMAGLTVPSPTLWISTHAGRAAPPAPVIRAPAPADPPVRTSAAKAPAKLTARPPSAEDLAAVKDEIDSGVEHLYFRPGDLSRPDVRAELLARGPGLLVVDAADQLSAAEADAVATVRPGLRAAPLLALMAPPPGRRDCERLAERLGMHDIVIVRGGS